MPCPTCPWRLSSTEGGSDIPNFNIDLMRALRNTVGRGDDFRPIMSCHYSEEGEDYPCNGYVAVVGWSNLALRIMAMEGRLDIRGVMEACEGLELWDSFEEMLEAYEEAAEMEGSE